MTTAIVREIPRTTPTTPGDTFGGLVADPADAIAALRAKIDGQGTELQQLNRRQQAFNLLLTTRCASGAY